MGVYRARSKPNEIYLTNAIPFDRTARGRYHCGSPHPNQKFSFGNKTNPNPKSKSKSEFADNSTYKSSGMGQTKSARGAISLLDPFRRTVRQALT